MQTKTASEKQTSSVLSKSFLVVSLTRDVRKPERKAELLLCYCNSHFCSAERFHGSWNWELTEFKYFFHFCRKGFFSEAAFFVRLFSLKSSHSELLTNSSVILLGFLANLKENGQIGLQKVELQVTIFHFHFQLNLNSVLSLTWNGSVEHISETIYKQLRKCKHLVFLC